MVPTAMRPTREQIEVAAYQRWERRGYPHGGDRDDWGAAEKDLNFALNYRYVARHRLADTSAGPVLLGKAEAGQAKVRRRCRFCEHAEPSAAFADDRPAVPALFGNRALVAWDECDDCRAQFDEHLAGPLEAFARPLLGPEPAWPRAGIPAPALKALVRLAISLMPAGELHHFGDTAEWVMNPDHDRDAPLLKTLGCHVYLTPAEITVPFAALSRRSDGEAPLPYMLFFLGASRAVFQTHLPLCPLDEDLEDEGAELRGPELSMSINGPNGPRASRCAYLPVAPISRVAAGRA